jgi:hypothetical protein
MLGVAGCAGKDPETERAAGWQPLKDLLAVAMRQAEAALDAALEAERISGATARGIRLAA